MNLREERLTPTHQPTFLWREPAAADLDETRSGELGNDEDRLLALIGTDLHIYHLESLLGRGGMGWVFLARHRDLHRSCAVKILAPRLAQQDPDYVARFQNEGRAAAALVHPNIVTTHAIGTCGDLHFLEMEFVRGRSLQNRIAQGPLSPLLATSLAAQIAAGLAAAHQEGIVHRDLKPDNILLTHEGIPKITDFGLAKRLASDDGTRYTLAGTPHFMAPELFLGQEPTPASDVYALGVCLYRMLTGHYPFTRPKLTDLIAAVTNDPLPHLRLEHPHIPLEIAESVFAMLARSPANRPRDGIEAAQLLQAVLGGARDIETLLHEALDDLPTVAWRADGPQYVATVELADDRRQRVFIEATNGEDRLLTIYSVCGPVNPQYYAEALRLNASIIHGALAIREIEGTPHYVMVNNYPRATVDAEEIRQSVLDAALNADALERRLTGGDQH
jgi:serine/threonine-protein kinase